MDFIKCPLCGYELSMSVGKYGRGKLKLEFWCEGGGDDFFHFEIRTGLSNSDIGKLKVGKPAKKEIIVEVLEKKKTMST
jgi:hypothetical protein